MTRRPCKYRVEYVRSEGMITREILDIECINCNDMEGYHECYEPADESLYPFGKDVEIDDRDGDGG